MYELINAFIDYFRSRHPDASPLSVKNYASDLRAFFSWCEHYFSQPFSPSVFTKETIDIYVKTQRLVKSKATVARYHASLRAFSAFLMATNHITEDPFFLSQAVIRDPYKLHTFRLALAHTGASELTIKNYIADVRQFLAFVRSEYQHLADDDACAAQISVDTLIRYRDRLAHGSDLATASINRKLASLRRYLAHFTGETSTPLQKETLPIPASHQAIIEHIASHIPRQEPVVHPLLGFIQAAVDSIIVIPFVSVIQRFRRYITFVKMKHTAFHTQIPQVVNLPTASVSRPKSLRTRLNLLFARSPLSTYFSLFALMVLAAGLGVGLFRAFGMGVSDSQLLAAPVSPLRILSFQGRLTDTNDNPVTAQRWIRFVMYNDVSSSGSARLWEEVRFVSPDSDGIFNVLLGSNASGGNATLCNSGNPPVAPATGACGIPQSLFSQNNTLYMGVTIENTPELTPRQQLATVPYATNAEALQGMLPTTDSNVTTNTNTILALNGSGTLAISGAATTTFQSAGGQLALEGNLLSLRTAAGSNTNISLAPDGVLGRIDIQKPLINTTLNNNIPSAAGAVEVNDLFAVLATSSGQSAITVNQDGAGPIISASASGALRFGVANSGTITIPAYTVGGGILYTNTSGVLSQTTAGALNECLKSAGGGVPTWGTCGAGGTSVWTLNSAIGALYPINETLDLFVGGTSTNSAEFAVLNIAGGTPTASVSAIATGTALSLGGDGVIQSVRNATLTLGGNTTGDIRLLPRSGNGAIALDSGTIISNQSTVNLFNTGVSTLNIGGAATTLSIGAGSGTTTINNGLTVNGATTINNTFTTTGTTNLGNDTGDTINVTGRFSSSLIPTTTNTVDLGSSALAWRALYAQSMIPAGTTGTQGWWQRNDGAIAPTNIADDLLVGGIATTSAKFAVLNMAAGTPIASLSATTTGLSLSAAGTIQSLRNATLTIGGDITGNITLLPGNGSGVVNLNAPTLLSNQSIVNVFHTGTTTLNIGGAATTISLGNVSGTTTVNSGLTVTGTTTVNGTFSTTSTTSLGDDTSDSINVNGRFATSLIPSVTNTYDLGTLSLAWRSIIAHNFIPAGTGGTQGWWQRNTGAISPTNITDDLLLGGIATNSARFAILNMAAGTPTATISGNLSLAVPTTLTTPGSFLNLYNAGTLSIRNSVGGDSGLSATPALFIANTGNVGLGTNTPGTYRLDVSGAARVSNDLYVGGGSTAGVYFTDGSVNTYGLLRNASGFLALRSNSATDQVIINNNGNVSIGTSTPLTRTGLHVETDSLGNATFLVRQLSTSPTAGDIITASNSGGLTRMRLDAAGTLYASRFTDIDNPVGSYFLDPAATATSLTTAGSVAIATTSPVARLTVAGDAQIGYDTSVWPGGLGGWTLRRQILLQNNSGTTLTNYQQRIVLDTATLVTAGKLRSDCNDLRFTDEDGSTLLDFWLESGCNTSATTLWVEIPTIPGGQQKRIYLYYGNSGAASVSSVANTFLRQVSNVAAAWRLDEPTANISTATDYSGNLNNAYGYSGTTSVTGLFNTARSFGGTSDYIAIPSTVSTTLSNTYSISLWVRTTQTAAQTLIRKDTTSGTRYLYGININDNTANKACFQFFNGTSNNYVCSTSNVNDGVWHHIVGIMNASNQMSIYFDGVLQAGPTAIGAGGIGSPTGEINIGAAPNCGASCSNVRSQFFNGTLDEVRIYNKVLSGAEITDMYANRGNNYGYVSPYLINNELLATYTRTPPAPVLMQEQNVGQLLPSFYVQNTTGNIGLGTNSLASTSARLTVAGDVKSGLYDNTTWGSGLSSYPYRSRITIDNTATSSALTNYQVQVTVNTQALISAGKMRSDCNDIRFADSDGNTLIDYWIETSSGTTSSCNSTTTTIWVEVPTILASTRKFIYMYYGNPIATAASSGSNTFDSFTDFSSLTGWTNTGSTTVTSDAAVVATGSLYSNATLVTMPGFIVETKLRYAGGTPINQPGLSIGMAQNPSNTTGTGNRNRLAFLLTSGNPLSPALGYGNDGTVTGSYNIVSGASQTTIAASTYYTFGIAITPNQFVFYNNRSITNAYTGTFSGAIYGVLGDWQGSSSGTTDITDTTYEWLLARKYSATPPVITVESEQDASQTNTVLAISNEFSRVGINTANPIATLDIMAPSTQTLPVLRLENTGDVRTISLNQASSTVNRTAISFNQRGTEQFIMGTDLLTNNSRDFFIYDSVALANRLYIDSNGGMGIRTSTLTTSDTLTIGLRPLADNFASLRLSPQNNTGRGFKFDSFDDNTTSRYFSIYDVVNAATRFQISNSGAVHVGAGSSEGGKWFNIQGDSLNLFQTQVVMKMGTSGSNEAYLNYWYSTEAASSTKYFLLTRYNTGTNAFVIRTDGSFANISDVRLKRDIVAVPNALEKVLSIRGVNYYWNNTSDENPAKQLGVIAQEIEPYVPELVQTESNGYKMVNYLGFTGLFIEAIKDLNTKIDATNSALLSNLAITTTGNLNIVEEPSSLTDGYHIYTAENELVTQMGRLAQLVTASIRTGALSAQRITTQSLAITADNITIAGSSLRDYIIATVRSSDLVGENNLLSPIASVDQIKTNVISPLAQDSRISVGLEDDAITIYSDTNASGAAVARIDNAGNATFSGTLNPQNLAVNQDATVSGTLYASRIQADQIVGLEARLSTISAQNITNVNNIYYATPSSMLAADPLSPVPIIPGASGSGVLNAPFIGYADIASYSGFLAYVPTLSAQTITATAGLTSYGLTTLSDTTIAGQLAIAGTLLLQNNTINTLGAPLEIQPLAQAGVSFMNGAITIDTSGNLSINGNTTIRGTLAASIISPLAENDSLTVRLGETVANTPQQLSVTNASGSAVLAVTNTGDLTASGAATVAKLNLSFVGQAIAVSDTESIATGSAGTAQISQYQKELTIRNTLVTPTSLIYITPVGEAGSLTPVLLRQTPGESFTVGVSTYTTTPIRFNWLIVN